MVTSHMNIAQEPLANAVFLPPCSPEDTRHRDRSKDSTNNSPAANVYQQDELRGDKKVTSRCQFTFSDGRQCRMPRAQLCAHHASKQQGHPGAEGAPDVALGGLE